MNNNFNVKISKFIDKLSAFLAARKGLLPLLGILLILVNLVLRFLPPNFLSQTDLLLHLGIILAIFGIMLAWAL